METFYEERPSAAIAERLGLTPENVRSLPASVLVLRLVAVRPEGEQLLGDYTFRHTPWPGAGGP